jgi:hypothetical protein
MESNVMYQAVLLMPSSKEYWAMYFLAGITLKSYDWKVKITRFFY